MADKMKFKNRLHDRRRRRVRIKIKGTADRPRLTVCKTLKHMYAQLIDDSRGETIVSVGTLSKVVADKLSSVKTKTEQAKVIGVALAESAKDKGVTSVVFDRNGRRYHGRVRALAEGAREGGLSF